MAGSSLSASPQASQTAWILNTARSTDQTSAGSVITLAGRILFSVIFITAGFVVPVSGVIAMLGGLSILSDTDPKIGAWFVVLFLVPVTLMMHNFWAAKDAMTAQMQMAMFMKNATMIGAALLISQFGPGPLSLDASRDSTR